MNEVKWMSCKDSELMLAHLYTIASARKLRLFGIACVRRIWHLLRDKRSYEIVEIAERYADDLASDEELSQATKIAGAIGENYFPDNWDETLIDAADAASLTAMDGRDGIFSNAFPITVCCSKALFGTVEDDRAESGAQSDLLRDIFGNPFRHITVDPSWLTPKVTSLAQSIYTDRAFDKMPELADALQAAGCDNEDILRHCRGPGPHVRGCWVVDLVLGKE